MLTLTDAVHDLYRVAVTDGRTQATTRMDTFADLCIQELSKRGILKAGKEVIIPGFGRSKRWDVAWSYQKKIRLGISLKSVLRNIAGSVPNRIDDLMGELVNVQLYSPEIVTGYVWLSLTLKQQPVMVNDGWVDIFRSYVQPLTGRKAPAWSPGTMESFSLVEVNFSNGPDPDLINPQNLDVFFDLIAQRLRERNPSMTS